jgi:CIC family chloride channel protein
LLLSGLDLAVDPLASMLTGMATLGVAIVGGPLTMSFLVLEMTRSVDVTAVVLAGCIVTSIFVRFMFGHSFSTWRLHLRGETIRSANDVGWLRNLTVERTMRTDVGKVPSTTTIAAVRREFVLGSRPAVVVVNNSDDYLGLVLLPELFSGELDSIADDIQVIELARYTDVSLLPEMNIKTAMKIFDDAEAEVLAVLESENSRKVIGFLTESHARRRYVDEIDQATRGVLGALS